MKEERYHLAMDKYDKNLSLIHIYKRYSFRLLAREPTDKVHLFEAAIDLLSYATYLKCEGKDYKAANLLSLSGVYHPKKELSESKIPIAPVSYTHLDVYKRQTCQS